MLGDINLQDLVSPILLWFQSNKRNLPWRADKNPYHIWVSEIMLQQTRVEAVIPYYRRFMENLPDIAALAACPEDRLLKLWEGLGYYSRVKNMQKAAQCMMEEGGRMPGTYDGLKTLPGIGPYTAGAIASIAYDEPVPAVDGNVLRVICRVCEDDRDIMKESTKKEIARALQEVMPREAGSFNQALMELGALVCLPNGAPKCERCPWETVCLARAHHTWENLPTREKRKGRRHEKKTVLLLLDGEKLLIRKRPDKGLLAGMYELPNLEGFLSRDEVLDFARERQLAPLYIRPLPKAKHIFSHVEWDMTGFLVRVADVESFCEPQEQSGYLLVETEEIRRSYAIPAAFGKYVEFLNISLGIS